MIFPARLPCAKTRPPSPKTLPRRPCNWPNGFRMRRVPRFGQRGLPSIGLAKEDRSPVCYGTAFELQTGLFEGACEGHIGFAPRGAGGFGYDPLFIPSGFEVSFAELGESVKNQISHRAKALAKVRAHLRRPPR